MRRIRQLDDFPADLRFGAVSIGNFDGVHRGHARIIERLKHQARRVDGPAIAFTFDPPPAAILRPEALPPPLTWLERKAELLEELGLDALVVYPTDRALLTLEAHEFFDQIVRRRLQARAMVEGPNFLFGRGRSGDVTRLADLCGERGVELEIVEPLREAGELISSSRVRQLVKQGDVAAAGRMLTRPYRVRGRVVRGAARGATIGFPTANLASVDTLLPAPGVYAGRAYGAGMSRPAAIHLGPIPTFQVEQSVLEVHLLDFEGDLYGRELEVELLDRIREIRPFSGVESLRAQLKRDIAQAREIAECPVGPPVGPPTGAPVSEPGDASIPAAVPMSIERLEVRVGNGERTREDVFRVFAERLRFPGYFGWNWDAFEECLRDLTWLPADCEIRLIHDGRPLAAEPPGEFETYRSILADVTSHWRTCGTSRRFVADLAE